VHTATLVARRDGHVRYGKTEELALTVQLYLPAGKLRSVDLDNRLKHIMDALQGRLAAEGKKGRRRKRIIHNDFQIFRVVIEKCLQPRKRTASGGLLVIRSLSK
jgi:Holliday junction resolvase RusA-like endonuclease